ncbi:3-dehydroquinate synthase [Sphingomicrobium astaxanthinifaciens]|uniref:3-dehydroquinate synthase n=1 Tax=Sphingomicrobium astaxanthinifaciens TaxID=1227949 RepID=UPI001FCB17BC|nr:3-dehydroquinate synthase [Sphingomicrobium astaxanthinifaciens]MCJ7420630.1 3-dehydroquinate synthase [Sphingomicrobium astaxanthinifaciens]
MKRIEAPARDDDRYPVLIGPMASAVAALGLDAAKRPFACLSDARVFGLHGDRLGQLVALDPFLLPEGEAAKCWDELERVIGFLSARNHQRSDPILALGGGAVGDLAGLAAALYRRGVPVIHLPTTLLAQVDSSVGGKTAIDAEGQKNLVGAFHPPQAVIIDPEVLRTLDARQWRAGLAETVKYGLIGDSEFYAWLVDGGARRLETLDSTAASHAIATAVSMKADLVAGDLEDRVGRRALLNLGHSFGHAIEALAGLGSILHGEAVAIGMVLAASFSVASGHLPAATADQIARDLAALGLPTHLGDAGLDGRGGDLLAPMRHDKKNEDGRLTLVLLRAIGEAFLARDVAEDALAAFLARL